MSVQGGGDASVVVGTCCEGSTSVTAQEIRGRPASHPASDLPGAGRRRRPAKTAEKGDAPTCGPTCHAVTPAADGRTARRVAERVGAAVPSRQSAFATPVRPSRGLWRAPACRGALWLVPARLAAPGGPGRAQALPPDAARRDGAGRTLFRPAPRTEWLRGAALLQACTGLAGGAQLLRTSDLRGNLPQVGGADLRLLNFSQDATQVGRDFPAP